MAAAGQWQQPGDFEGSIREEELEAQVREYYEAVSERDARRAEMLAGTKSRQREERNEALWTSGLETLDVTDLIIYPCGGYRIVIVSYDMKIENIETKFPGAETFAAKRTAEGEFLLLFSESMEQLSEDDREMIWQRTTEIMNNQDVMDFFGEIDQRYIEAKVDSDLREWEENWLEKRSRAVQEEEIKQESEIEQKTGGEVPKVQEDADLSAGGICCLGRGLSLECGRRHAGGLRKMERYI